MNKSHEIVSFKFRSELAFERQVLLMKQLSQLVQQVEGFVSRECFYSSSHNSWVDHVVWSSHEQAIAAASLVMQSPLGQQVFSQIDESSVVMDHYESVERIAN